MLHPFVSAGRPARWSKNSLLFSGAVHLVLLGLLLQQRAELRGAIPRATGESVSYVHLSMPRLARGHGRGLLGRRLASRSAYVRYAGPPAPINASFEPASTAAFTTVDPSAIIDSLMAQVARAGVGEVLASLEDASPIGGGPATLNTAATSDTGAVAMPMNPKPVYPPSMIGRNQEAEFSVYFVVDTTGRVDTATVAVPVGVPEPFAVSVRQVLTKWIFRPAMHRGLRVRQEVLQPFTFRLRT